MEFIMSLPVHLLVTFMALLMAVIFRASAYSDRFYTAAVYEHTVFYNYSTEENIRINLAYYRNAARVAKNRGADIIIFPEYGILAVIGRDKLIKNAEYIPNPKYDRVNPCTKPEWYAHRPILRNLSCIARAHSIVVVANTAHVEPCQEETDCPDDGSLFHNTNVAFDSDGTLIGRYHKERLFSEISMDLPREKQNPTFTTMFGRFGMLTSFDIVYKRITEIAKEGVEAILLPAVWVDTAPFMISVQMWQWWAIGNNVTFMSANVHHPGFTAVGSGIFTARGVPLGYTHNPDGRSKLIVAKVPRTQFVTSSIVPDSSAHVINLDGTVDHRNDGDTVPEQCSFKLLDRATDFFSDFRCSEENMANYTFVKLKKMRGHVQACNNGLCCSVRYSANDMLENYYLGVYNGTQSLHDSHYAWCQQNCLLVRCDTLSNSTCATFPMRSKTRFRRVFLTANITAEYIYPTILASGIRLVPVSDWIHGARPDKAYINYESAWGKALLMIGLHGRCYSNDPPYIR